MQNWSTFEERAVLVARAFKVWNALWNKVVLPVGQISYFLHFSLLYVVYSKRPLVLKFTYSIFSHSVWLKRTQRHYRQARACAWQKCIGKSIGCICICFLLFLSLCNEVWATSGCQCSIWPSNRGTRYWSLLLQKILQMALLWNICLITGRLFW